MDDRAKEILEEQVYRLASDRGAIEMARMQAQTLAIHEMAEAIERRAAAQLKLAQAIEREAKALRELEDARYFADVDARSLAPKPPQTARSRGSRIQPRAIGESR
jgi:hypothetical protein